jgi:hypothetical protein
LGDGCGASSLASAIWLSIGGEIRHLLGMLSRRAFGSGLCAGAAGILLEVGSARAKASRELFSIARSKNANTVRYAVRLARDGSLDLAQPIEAYWLMLAEDGHREELTWTERKLAYGFATRNVTRSGCLLALTACPKREVAVLLSDGGYRAQTTIRGSAAVLTRIFVRAHDQSWLPSVEYVELIGTSLAGEPVRERLAP